VRGAATAEPEQPVTAPVASLTVDRMRSVTALIVLAVIVADAACSTASPLWAGNDVHQVDGHRVGIESACAAGDDICTAVVADAGREPTGPP